MASRILTMQHPTHNKFNNSTNGNAANGNASNYQAGSVMISSSSSTSSSASSSCNNSVSQEPNATASLSNVSLAGAATGASKLNLGLMNSDGKYLTAESFGYKINATGNTLRKKQKWTIEQDNDEFVYLISPLCCYLSADKYGKLTCEKQTPDVECKFLLESNNDGKWSFKSVTHGYYFGGNGDRLHCFSKTPEWWTIHLAIHPQVFEREKKIKEILIYTTIYYCDCY